MAYGNQYGIILPQDKTRIKTDHVSGLKAVTYLGKSHLQKVTPSVSKMETRVSMTLESHLHGLLYN
eukprot:11789969-Ditylum_brightwellii.AAC.1